MKEFRKRKRFQPFQDLFQDELLEPNSKHLPVDASTQDITQKKYSHWRDTRIVAHFASLAGIISIVVAMPYFQTWVTHPVLLNFVLMIGILGFANIAIYPYQVERFLAGDNDGQALPTMRWSIIAYMSMVSLFLLTIPISGLALLLILCPAPIYMAVLSKKLIENAQEYRQILHDASGQTLLQDLHKVAWLSILVLLPVLFLTGVLSLLDFIWWT